MQKLLETMRLKLVALLQPAPAAPGPETKLLEAYGATIDPDEDQWRKLTESGSKRDLTPLTQHRMQEMALYLWESNLLANRIIELTTSYLLAEGVRLVAADEAVQEVIDKFSNDPINEFDLKLWKKVRELLLFGEQCWPAFVNEVNGHVRIGNLDPALIETIVTDPDNGEQKIGIVTCKDKKGYARRYRIIVNGAEEDLFTARTRAIRDTFVDGECFYFAVNDLSNGRRGRSILLAQIDWLDAYDQFLFGEAERAAAMRAFIWDVTLTGATPEEVKKRAGDINAPKANSVRVHNDAEVWKAESPDLKAQDSSENARLFRNHILGGATVPEHWYGGGGDVNRSTGESMGEPTLKVFTMIQTFIGYMLITVGKYVIRQWELKHNNREPDLNDPVYKLEAQFPEMTARDTTKYAAALQQVTVAVGMAVDRGLMTEETAIRIIENMSARLGVEFDAEEELAAARKVAEKKKEEDVIVDPPEDPGAPPTPGQPPNPGGGGMKEAADAAEDKVREAVNAGKELLEASNAALSKAVVALSEKSPEPLHLHVAVDARQGPVTKEIVIKKPDGTELRAQSTEKTNA